MMVIVLLLVVTSSIAQVFVGYKKSTITSEAPKVGLKYIKEVPGGMLYYSDTYKLSIVYLLNTEGICYMTSWIVPGYDRLTQYIKDLDALGQRVSSNKWKIYGSTRNTLIHINKFDDYFAVEYTAENAD